MKKTLKKIEKLIEYDLENNDGVMVNVHYKDIETLIKQVRQDEKLIKQVLYGELPINSASKIVDKVIKQNKRYKEALKFYANKENYKMKNNGLVACVPINVDKGDIAQFAIEE